MRGQKQLSVLFFKPLSLDTPSFVGTLNSGYWYAGDDVARHWLATIACPHFRTKEDAMSGKDLKKVLANLGIAALVSAIGVTVPSQLQAGSG